MKAVKNLFLFFYGQWRQIKTGGLQILCRKIKKAGKSLFMSVCAPIAVYFKTDWLEAYDHIGNRALVKIKKLRLQPDVNKTLMNELMENATNCFKKTVAQEPDLLNLQDWIRRSMVLESLNTIASQQKDSTDSYRKIDEVQRRLAKKHQLDNLGLVFVPRVIARGSIGVYENLDIYIKAGILGLRPNKKMFLLLESEASVNNPCYFKYWSKYVTVVTDPLLMEAFLPLEKCLTAELITMMPIQGKVYKSFLTIGKVREQWLRENRSPILTLSDEDFEKGWQCLNSLGMPKDGWFVCLHVREPGWRDSGSREEDFRNADINTYIPAIKAITDAGGWVVRIGDSGMNKLPPMPQVIDYAHCGVKSDWMDIFLCAQCRFMIGTASGMYNISMAFGVPVVMTNLLPAYALYCLTSQDLFIPRLCWSKEREGHLSFRELISPPVGSATSQSQYDDRNIQVIENTAEEIRELVEEMLEKYSGALIYNEAEEVQQGLFKEMAGDCGTFYGDINLALNARIGSKFLSKYAQLLPAYADGGCTSENKR